ncbi:DUF6493 family protein [Streptomyces sp. NPDC086549]|uniref:DUF7824 domain-containing protein n=1 Tax=Streptomyces sp. NPDC086549 TaxID=3365752 RepID=UPI0037F11EF5
MSSLIEAVRAGRVEDTLRLVKRMSDAERRSVLPELRALRKEGRTAPWGIGSRNTHPALHAAGAACHTGAAAAASWLSASDMRWWRASPETLLRALEGRDAGWLADVAQRLAQRPVSADVPYELMSGLAHRAGCDVPVTDAYVVGWIRHVSASRQRGTLVDLLRREQDLARLVPGLFVLTDLRDIRWLLGDGPGSWQHAIAELAGDGTLDRKTVVDACVARLLRGGGPTDHRVFLPLLVRLGLTREEERERTADWVALARDAASPVASHAQSVLASHTLDGELTTGLLAEASEGVLFRTEKKLVRAQLVLLGKVLARDPSAAAELLPVVAQAFGHEDTDVQERALKLVERHTKKLDSDDLRAELAHATEQLTPSLRTRAADALGITAVDPAPAVYEDVLPPAPEPVRLAPAPGTAVELAEEVGALLASGGDVAAFERVLDGLVRQAYQNPDALLDALDPVTGRRWWHTAESGQWRHANSYFNVHNELGGAQDGLDLLLATLWGRVETATLHRGLRSDSTGRGCVHDGLSQVFGARLREVAYRLRTDPLPLLLSTPTWSTGLLEPDELVDRLDTYRRLDARVSAADFAQALLRVRRTDPTAAAAAARRAAALGTVEGDRLARRLSSKGPELPLARRRTSATRIVVELGELPDLQADLPAEYRRLGRPLTAYGEGSYCSHWSHEIRQHWLAALPEQRELVAARMVHDLSRAAVNDTRGPVGVLPLLAESGGEAGDSVHLCVAYGLGARQSEDRLAAVDALLVLASRGQLDTARLGSDLGVLVHCGAVKPLRLAESARTAAATGANATIWEMLRHTLPVLLADPATASPRGLGDLLAVAAECAERSGARGELPHLAQAAARPGSSRLATQARRLRDALAASAQ